MGIEKKNDDSLIVISMDEVYAEKKSNEYFKQKSGKRA